MKVKKILSKFLNGVTLPVLSSQLRGIRLKVSPLMPGNLFYNSVEKEVHNVYNIFITENSVVFDVGANVGLHSYYISRRFENSRVYAFEPYPGNAKYMRQMIAINHIFNISVVEKAVGEYIGSRYFDASLNTHQGHLTDIKSDLVVEMISLDYFIKVENTRPDFVKIDVEGAESEVLNGFINSIDDFHPIILIELHTRDQAYKVAEFFKKQEYSLFKLLKCKNSRQQGKFLQIENTVEFGRIPMYMDGQILAIPKDCKKRFSGIDFK